MKHNKKIMVGISLAEKALLKSPYLMRYVYRKFMWDKSIPRLAFIMALKVTVGIVIAMLIVILINGAVGSVSDIILRCVLASFGAQIILWLVFVFHIYANPEIWENAQKRNGNGGI